jgi:hypothetical protein
MINKKQKITIILICVVLTVPIFIYAVSSPSVQISANGLSTSPVAVSYNDSFALTWYSSNTNSCQASGGWTGTKNTSGKETINHVSIPQSYIITCTGAGGSASAKIDINVINTPVSLQVTKLVRNASTFTSYQDVVSANPGEKLSFQIQLTTGFVGLNNVVLKDTLPSRIIYQGNLKIDGIDFPGDITSGIGIGNLSNNQTKTITFDAVLVDSSQFGSGITTLINSVLAYNSVLAKSDTAKVIIDKTTGTSGGTPGGTSGGPTTVPTGLTNNLFLDSFFLPLAMTILMIWLFKSHIINFEEWMDNRKKEYDGYKTKKILQLKIAQIKAQEFFRKKL